MAAKAIGPIKRAFAPWEDPAARPFIRFEGVTKRFGDFVAVDSLSLDIYEREFFALLGPSGCGKTTLLRMLAGFETPSEGRILLEGSDISTVPPHRRPVNMMFQSYALFPHMSVEKNIAFGLKQDGLPRDQIEARVAEMLKLVKLEPFARRKPHQLSGGQRQRVALARSLAKRPKVLLLDEPLGALDKKLREETQFELMDLQQQTGLTFVIVTHDQEEAMTVSDRIAVMDHGKLVQVATPAVIYEYPNSRYVADFIGNVNFLEGRISRIGRNDVELVSNDVPCPIVAIHDGDLPATTGDTAWLAIRPEKMRISLDAPEAATRNCVKGEVWDIGYLGDLSIYHVRLPGGQIIKSAVANQTRLVERPIGWDDTVYVSWPDDAGIVLTK
ncbi:putrescine transport system ATP-binding protein [Tepidamorphus gemmatus]|uniref:Spermidine/putrescine import ATP-binding protein PotA n=1 Tax=Tepidamorphus gemmatus TaxID=747076 RepID=A0A4R3MFU3_9HYPH|nr:ABC transporter ATP-binding protein [Tepidamorphus gemmatus]TCT12032.1 putrescine transport system ATP-binding protein [Tepidamorphus gemmatus]